MSTKVNLNGINEIDFPSSTTASVSQGTVTITDPAGVPSGGATGDVLTKNSSTDYDASWQPPIITAPGGSDTQVQFNDAGVFNGDSSFTFNKTSKLVTVTGTTAGAGNAELVLTGYPTNKGLVVKGNTFFGTALPPNAVTSATLVGWYKPETLAAAYTDGAPITLWADSSGLNHDLAGFTSHYATYKTNIQNGFGVARFAGSQYLQTNFTLNNIITTFIVYNKTVGTSGKCIYDGYGDNKGAIWWPSATQARLYDGAVLVGNILDDGQFHLLDFVLNGATSKIVFDGTTVGSGNAGTVTGTNGITVGSQGSLTVPYQGDVLEVITFAGVISDVERVGVENYIAAKYNLVLSTGIPQSANLTEWQKFDGTVVTTVDGNGIINVPGGSNTAPGIKWGTATGIYGGTGTVNFAINRNYPILSLSANAFAFNTIGGAVMMTMSGAAGRIDVPGGGGLCIWNGLNGGSGTVTGYIQATKYQMGGTTASYPMLKQNGTVLESKLADDSAYTKFKALDYVSTIASKTTTYTAVAGDTVLCDTSSAAFTVTLPLAVDNIGCTIVIKKITNDANAVTVGVSGSDTIDGASTQIISTFNASMTIRAGASGLWYII
jgi:hypothetical protein